MFVFQKTQHWCHAYLISQNLNIGKKIKSTTFKNFSCLQLPANLVIRHGWINCPVHNAAPWMVQQITRWMRPRDFLWMVDFWRFINSYPTEYWIGMGYVNYRDRKNNFIFAVEKDMASLTRVISKPSACWWHWWHGAELTFSVAIIVIHSTSNFFFQ